jgi:hypothetical protein
MALKMGTRRQLLPHVDVCQLVDPKRPRPQPAHNSTPDTAAIDTCSFILTLLKEAQPLFKYSPTSALSKLYHHLPHSSKASHHAN